MVRKILDDDLVRFYDVDAKKSDDTLRARRLRSSRYRIMDLQSLRRRFLKQFVLL